jgi:hypothetical protein
VGGQKSRLTLFVLCSLALGIPLQVTAEPDVRHLPIIDERLRTTTLVDPEDGPRGKVVIYDSLQTESVDRAMEREGDTSVRFVVTRMSDVAARSTNATNETDDDCNETRQ